MWWLIGLVVVVIALASLWRPRPVRPPAPLASDPIVDMHCHIAGIGAGGSGCHLHPHMRKSWKYKPYLRCFHVSHEELNAFGDALVVERLVARLRQSSLVQGAVILAMDGVIGSDGELDLDRTQLYVPNSHVFAQVAKYDCLFAGASVNPYRRDALEQLEAAKRQGAVLLKWLPAIQQIDVADAALVPFYQRLVELDLPLLTHTGAERSFTHADHDAGDPERLRLPLELGVTVIAAHVASTGRSHGQRQIDRLIALFPHYPNLYTDISSLTQLNKLGYLNKVLRHPEMFDRLLYGTDMPLPDTPLVSPWFFPLNLRLGQMRKLASVGNAWDQDVLLKQALGVPPECFTRAVSLLDLAIKPRS